MGLIFAAAILLSAALMFIVELMFAKMVLPRLGGSPSVWNTCLVFYQTALMAGYVYAHLSLKWLGPRRQSLLHIALLCVACVSLPIGLAQGWVPPSERNPIPWLLMLLTVCVGLPFFCISASAPLLQAWFSYCGSRSGKDPYFLYAASNLGSLAGLAAYPLLIEPRLTLVFQTRVWSAGYALLVVLFGLCAAAVWIAGRRQAAADQVVAPADSAADSTSSEEPVSLENSDSLPDSFHRPITLGRRLWWLALALVPSALLMGVTAHLSVDIASVPLLWAIPLGLYLLSFIVVFARWPILKWLWLLRFFQAAAVVGAVATMYHGGLETEDIMRVGALHLTAFFLTAVVCHGAMAADRPASKHLTEYFLWMSAGGVAGGLLCALVAPLVFNSVAEYPLALVAACLLGPPLGQIRHKRLWQWSGLVLILIQSGLLAFACFALRDGRLAGMADKWDAGPLKQLAGELTNSTAKIWWIATAGIVAFLSQRHRRSFALAVAALLCVCMICEDRVDVIYSARSFFGVLRVELGHYDRDGDSLECHTLMHGSTMHGQQSRDPDDALDPWTYYCHSGPIGDLFAALEDRPEYLHHGHIGVVGLGTGTVAAYAKPGQSLTYFEIDAAVRRISKDPQFFTYISNCKVDPDIRMGDARLTLASEPDGKFDMLIIDAFSSDSIPIHLLTCEALELYFQKLAPHGLLVVHLSNRHLHLGPVVAGEADELRRLKYPNLVARVRDDDDESDIGKTSSTWSVLARATEDLGRLKDNEEWVPLKADHNLRLWTDDYSSIVSVMNWGWLPEWVPKWLRPRATE